MELQYFGLNLEHIIIILSVVCVLLLILCIASFLWIGKVSGKLTQFMGSRSSRHDLRSILLDYYEHVELVDAKYSQLQSDIASLYKGLQPCFQKIGMVRYNPFDNMGGDLSYVLVLLDGSNNGFIINTMFSRESSHTYCKPVVNGTSEYSLSYEENQALKRALGVEKKQPRGSEALKAEKIQL